MKLFQLTLQTLIVRKSWIVALIAVAVVPFLLPLLVPSEFALNLIKPARAQAAWVILWFVSMFWLFGQAARQGDLHVHSGLGSYFRSMGTGSARQFIELWLAFAVFLTSLTLVTVLVCLFAASPAGEFGAWLVLNLQSAVLSLAVLMPLTMLALAFGSRFGSLVGFLVSLGLAIYGLYGVGYIEFATFEVKNILIRSLYAVSPQFHLGDLSEQVVFQMGSLKGKLFTEILVYLLGVGLIVFSGSIFTYRATARS